MQNQVYVCNINFMFMLCLCLVYEATSCVKKQTSFCACVYDVRIVQYDWSNNRSQALFKTIDHRSHLPNNFSYPISSSNSAKTLQVSIDGPTVNHKFYSKLVEHRKEISAPGMIDIGSC